jgi:hypothetical protein
VLLWVLNLGFGASGAAVVVTASPSSGSLPLPPNLQPILTIPDADIAVRITVLQYLARLVQAIQKSQVTTYASWTPGTIGNGGFASATVTVRGLSPPMPCYVGFTVAVPAGCILHAVCTSTDTVTITLYNFTGVSQNFLVQGILQVTGLTRT